MARNDMRKCEIKFDGAWQPVPVDQAHRQYRNMLKRCPACHGKVFTSSTYSADARLKFQHYRNHTGCPLTPAYFSGKASEHPDALD